MVLLVSFFKPKEARGRKSEGVKDSRGQGVGEAKDSRIRGFKGSSGSLGIFFQTKRGKGSEKRRFPLTLLNLLFICFQS